ncbi:putative F-box/LRR-repeat protein At5g02930 [Prosopis cineraria]|uniref:putative F-box/LRR-repeat protein At5g02930 n=1 Tax=Prosopis cineraria TaxID=364024 RepID=UPI00241082EF|nr:putative F-box/LRR-repeat protein At5g02930 [Prosopis cineraria]
MATTATELVETPEMGKAEPEMTMMEDKLTSLPDEILQYILSFLDTKIAVQTSVVCKRLRYLWISLPVLTIDSESFRYYSSFSNFVVSLLARKDVSISICKFLFDISNPIYSSIQMCIDSHDLFEPLVKGVIHHVVDHGVQHLSLHFPRIVDELPQLFYCQSLKTLELREIIILPKTNLDFLTLTTLHLVKCSFILDGEGTLDPFQCCFNLKNLVISDCRIPSRVKIFEISAPQLTNLTVSRIEHSRNVNPNCKIVLTSTKITSFKFVESHILEFSIPALPFIENVDVDAALADDLFGTVRLAKRKFILHLIEMLRAVGGAEIVALSFETIIMLSKFLDVLHCPSPFSRMKVLKVEVPHDSFTIPGEVITFLSSGSAAEDFKVEYLKKHQGRAQGRLNI